MARTVLALVLIAACGPRDIAPAQDFGPPPQPVDPIACPAARLERFAAATDTTLTIATEPVVDAGRIDRIPCKTDEKDDACLARARKRPAPPHYEVTGVTMNADIADLEYTYDLDGRRITERASSVAAMVARLKTFQAAGHKVTLIRGESTGETFARHAAISYRGLGGSERRVGTLRWRPTKQDTDIPAARSRAIEQIQAQAETQHVDLRNLDTTDDTTLVATVTCGP